MKRSPHTLLIIAVLVFVSLLLVSSAVAGARGGGKKWGASAFVVQ
jgi:hypothetical protein